MIPDPLVEEVRLRADIVEIIGEHVSLKRAGREFKGLCPFHHEKTPSFGVVPSKNFYKCFGCGESGDVYSFLMKHLGLTFTDAVRTVAARVGIEIPDATADRQADDPNRPLYEAIAFAEDWFRGVLRDAPEGEGARQYLARRGVGPDAVERFRIGAAPDAWRALREAAHRHGIEDAVLLGAGLIKDSERSDEPYDRFRDRVIFPIAEANDRTIAFGGRLRGRAENAPKYLNSPETAIYHKGRILYGLNWSKGAIRRDGGALVVEGYMDYVSLASRGIENVVAGMGTALTPEQANLVARYSGKAWLLYDSDAAGLKATFRSADALLRAGVHPLVVTLPPGDDPDTLVRTGGAEALKPLLDAAVDVLEKKLQILDTHGYLDDIEGKRRALDRLLPTLRAVVDAKLRDLYIDTIETRTGVRRETLERELAEAEQRPWTPDSRPARPVARVRPREPEYHAKRGEAERLLVLLMLRDARWIGPAAADVRPSDLRDAVYREIYQALIELPDDEAVDPSRTAEAVAAVVGEEARAVVARLRKDQTEISDGDRTLRDVVADIKAPALFLRLEDLDRRMQTASEDDRSSLLRERRQVNEALSALNAGGFKFSPRYRRFARGERPGHTTPSTEDS